MVPPRHSHSPCVLRASIPAAPKPAGSVHGANTPRGHLGPAGARFLTPAHGQPGYKLILCRPGVHYWSCSMQLHFLGLIWESEGESLQEQEEGGFQHCCIPGVCRWFPQQGMLTANASSPSHPTAGEWIFPLTQPLSSPLKCVPQCCSSCS